MDKLENGLVKLEEKIKERGINNKVYTYGKNKSSIKVDGNGDIVYYRIDSLGDFENLEDYILETHFIEKEEERFDEFISHHIPRDIRDYDLSLLRDFMEVNWGETFEPLERYEYDRIKFGKKPKVDRLNRGISIDEYVLEDVLDSVITKELSMFKNAHELAKDIKKYAEDELDVYDSREVIDKVSGIVEIIKKSEKEG